MKLETYTYPEFLDYDWFIYGWFSFVSHVVSPVLQTLLSFKMKIQHKTHQGNVDWVQDLDANIFRWEFADTIFSGVGICFLSIKATIVLDVFKGLGWQPSIASLVVESLGTVYKLLFWQRDTLSKGLVVSSLKRSSRAAKGNYLALKLKTQFRNSDFIPNQADLKVQQDPQWPWSLTGLTMPDSLQSFYTYSSRKISLFLSI